MVVEGHGLIPRLKLLSEHQHSKIFYTPAFKLRPGKLKRVIRFANMVLYGVFSLAFWMLYSPARRAKHAWFSVPHTIPAILAIVVSKFGRSVIYEVRDPWPDLLIALGIIRENSIVAKVLRIVDQNAQRAAEHIVVFSEENSFVNEACRKKIIRIENGIPGLLDLTVGLDHGRSERGTKFIYAGGCANAFKMEVILQAFASARSLTEREFKFTLLTAPPEIARFRIHVQELGLEDVVEFGEMLEFAQLYERLYESDFYVFHLTDRPIFRKGINSNKLLDAFSTLTPIVIAAEVANNHVRDSHGGFWGKPDDAQELARLIADACECSGEAYTQMQQRMLGYATGNLTVQAALEPLALRMGIPNIETNGKGLAS